MTIYYDKMNFSNVVMREYLLENDNLEKIQNTFFEKIVQRDYGIKGPFVYSVRILSEEKKSITMIMPVDIDLNPNDEDLDFYSYYSLEHTICARVPLEQLKDAPNIINEMIKKCKNDGNTMYGPAHFVYGADYEDPYYLINIGVM